MPKPLAVTVFMLSLVLIPRMLHADWYVTASLGGVEEESIGLSEIGYRLGLGYSPADRSSFELAYVNLGGVQDLLFDSSIAGLTASYQYRFFDGDTLHLHARGGVYDWRSDDLLFGNDYDTGTDPFFGLSLSWPSEGGSALMLEIEAYRVEEQTLNMVSFGFRAAF